MIARFARWLGFRRAPKCPGSAMTVMADQTKPGERTVECGSCLRIVATLPHPDPHVRLVRFIEEHPL